ncbi:MAG: ester cyclase [Desulfobacteraceae bacterium]|nr:ester cyclase [Desulfobacteraceae bacterium]
MDNSKEERIKFGNDELIENGNLGVIDEIFATDYIAHAGDKNYKGHEFIKRWTRQLRLAIPDIRVVEVKFLIRTDETVAWQRSLRGTHKAVMLGIQPTEQKVEWTEMVVSRFDSGKIAEEWVVSELAGELLSKPSRV